MNRKYFKDQKRRSLLVRGLINTGIFTLSIIVSLIFAEFFLKAYFPYYKFQRFLFFSEEAFQHHQDDYIHFLPNKIIRSIAVYDGEAEFDVKFPTNNMGFLDVKDYPFPSDIKNRYALIGDSFTAGYHGGNPWLFTLRDRIAENNTDFYNLGISGTGLLHFEKLLRSLHSELHFTRIFIVVISDDFDRYYWTPLYTESQIRFCKEGLTQNQCEKNRFIAQVIPIETSVKELNSNFSSGAGLADGRRKKPKEDSILETSHLYGHLKSLGKERKTIPKVRVANKKHIEVLEKIVKQFPDIEIHLVHLPQKSEVRTMQYSLDPQKALKALNIRYFPALRECDWDNTMFYKKDSHPNRSGYNRIAECVSKYIRSIWQPPQSR